MAKKAKQQNEEVETEEIKSSDGKVDLEKKYGAGAFISAADFLEEPRNIVSVSPKVDLALGGGIPEGSFVILAGPPKCGKTVTALQIAGKSQQQFKRKVFYLNIEGRIKPRDIEGIKCLNPSDMEIIRSHKNEDGTTRLLYAHEFLEIAEKKLRDNPGCVLIVDSASQLLSQEEGDGDMDAKFRAPGAVLLSKFCKKISNVLPVNDNIVIMIVHIISNTGGLPGQKTKVRSGGNKIQYAVDVDLECTHIKPIMVGGTKNKDGDVEGGTQVGQTVFWKTGSTGIAPPGVKFESTIRYGVGIDETAEAIQLGKLVGLIRASGSWNYLDFLKSHPELFEEGATKWKEEWDSHIRFQGAEKANAALENNEKWIEVLKKELKTMLQ